ncbi:hypothetical protein FOA43_004564 [Brettanomyces nanus]|uniref:VOC domain-containing protein n=1 Tax=Eeniella nana TaxID=13502 RepID=A0A875SCG8_EENNA|nr:uncharacterized protein FOA43_004564 [Brettanomyces nanus]QPG77159.1 hypothetical protein FOA43_004564 [Brettanomyces nanus]
MPRLTNLTSLHVSDISNSIKFYSDAFGFKELSRVETPQYVSVFIGLGNTHEKHLARRDGVVELRQLKNTSVKIYNGNSDPYRGFGHLCVSVSNIVEAQKHLLKQGAIFQKRLEDGRQKDIAFVLDPDTYWIELIENAIEKKEGVYNLGSNRLNHTMIRIRDPKKSLDFYRNVLGMKLFSTRKHESAKFTLYFLGYEEDPNYVEDQEDKVLQAGRQSIIELTHNWGTELDDSFRYYVFGKDQGVVGFDHFTVSASDAKSLVDSSNAEVLVKYNEKPELKNTGVLADPDGWKVYIQDY